MTDPVALAREFYDAYNARDPAQIRAILAAGYHHRRNATIIEGADNYIAFFEREWANRPDGLITVKHAIPAGTGFVVEGAWTVTSNTPLTLPSGTILQPTGKTASLPFASVGQVRDGVLASDVMYYDTMSFWRELGHRITVE